MIYGFNSSLDDETLKFYYGNVGQITEIGYIKGSGKEKKYFFTRNLQGDILALHTRI